MDGWKILKYWHDFVCSSNGGWSGFTMSKFEGVCKVFMSENNTCREARALGEEVAGDRSCFEAQSGFPCFFQHLSSVWPFLWQKLQWQSSFLPPLRPPTLPGKVRPLPLPLARLEPEETAADRVTLSSFSGIGSASTEILESLENAALSEGRSAPVKIWFFADSYWELRAERKEMTFMSSHWRFQVVRSFGYGWNRLSYSHLDFTKL